LTSSTSKTLGVLQSNFAMYSGFATTCPDGGERKAIQMEAKKVAMFGSMKEEQRLLST
jgi:hypothetical protein